MSITVTPRRYTSKDPWLWGAKLQIDEKKFEVNCECATPQEAADAVKRKALDYFTTAIQTVRDSPILVNSPIEALQALTPIQTIKK